MFGFTKHCKICGIDLQEDSVIKRFGKSFCSDEHANQYVELKQQQQKDESSRKRGGCC